MVKNHRHPGKYKSRTPRGRTTFKKRPKHNHILKKDERRIFQRLDKEKFETGGYMDFNDRGLERADVYIGKRDSVDLDITPDKEVDYHTHPRTRDKRIDKVNNFPSKHDLRFANRVSSQAMIIFHDGRMTIATKGKRFRPSNKRLNKIERGLLKDSNKMSIEQLFKKYIPEYKKMGLDIKHIKKKGKVKIPLEVVEPIKADKKGTLGITFFRGTGKPGEPSIQDVSDEEARRLGFEEELERFEREREEDDQ